MPIRKQSAQSYSHIYMATQPLDNIYLGGKLIWQQTNPPAITDFSVAPNPIDLDTEDNDTTSTVTFVKQRTGVYNFFSSQLQGVTPQGSATNFPGLADMLHYYIGTSGRLSGPPGDSHYYQFAVSNTDTNYQYYTYIEINGRRYHLGNSGRDATQHGITFREYWTIDHIPNSADWVTDSRLSLSIKFIHSIPTRINFTLGVTGTPGTRVKRDSDFVFVRLGNTSRYVSHIRVGSFPARGSRSIQNNDVPTIGFNNISGPNAGLKYFVDFTDSFVKTKTPLNLEIDGTSYSLLHIESGYTLVSLRLETFATATSPIPSGDRVTDSDLTKAINIEAVDNEQVALTSGGLSATNIGGRTWTRLSYSQNRWNVTWVGSGQLPTALILNGRAFTLTRVGSTSNWQTAVITDANFQASSTKLSWGANLSLDNNTYFNNTRSYLFTGITGGNTYAQIYNAGTHAKVGHQQIATGGGDITDPVSNIERPDGPTNYRLVARNSGGASHKDTLLTITKNPTLSGLRRIGSLSRPGFTNYTFGFTLTGLPRPVVTYRFSGGQTGTVPTVHLRQGNNAYTWQVINWQITMPNSNAQSLTLTATNASGSVTARLENINS